MNGYDLTLHEWEALIESWGLPRYHGSQVHAWLWHRGARYDEMTELSKELRTRLAREVPLHLEVLAEREADGGATRKALLRVGKENHLVEVVLMGYPDRVTACVSTQAGCAMGCGFCATGQMGLKGNLTGGEIAAQIVWARQAAAALPDTTPQRLSNVVFMGMGEPLANYRHTREAIGRITDPAGIGLGARHVTVSTVGIVPGIRRLASDHPQVGLAVSLHAADDDLRGDLVPVNRLWPLGELVGAVEEWRARTGRRPSIEWAMIDGVNDSDAQATRLAPIANRLHAHVNLIPLNPTPGWPTRPSPNARIHRFAAVLQSNGVNVTIRDTRGRDIDAACGQLRWDFEQGSAGPAQATSERAIPVAR